MRNSWKTAIGLPLKHEGFPTIFPCPKKGLFSLFGRVNVVMKIFQENIHCVAIIWASWCTWSDRSFRWVGCYLFYFKFQIWNIHSDQLSKVPSSGWSRGFFKGEVFLNLGLKNCFICLQNWNLWLYFNFTQLMYFHYCGAATIQGNTFGLVCYRNHDDMMSKGFFKMSTITIFQAPHLGIHEGSCYHAHFLHSMILCFLSLLLLLVPPGGVVDLFPS